MAAADLDAGVRERLRVRVGDGDPAEGERLRHRGDVHGLGADVEQEQSLGHGDSLTPPRIRHVNAALRRRELFADRP